jgi:hypothetical protein
MGRDPAEKSPPDLFSTDTVRDASPPPSKQSAATAVADNSAQRHILPKNLRHALTQLSDGELDELFQAAFDEAKQRGRLPQGIGKAPAESSCRPSDTATKRSPVTNKSKRTQTDNAELPLTHGHVSAIRAAFKAGVKPSQIARHFRVSQSNVRKALASDPSKV